MTADLILTNAAGRDRRRGGPVIARRRASRSTDGRIAAHRPRRRDRPRRARGDRRRRHAAGARASSTPIATPAAACSAASSRACRSSPGCSRSGGPKGAILDARDLPARRAARARRTAARRRHDRDGHVLVAARRRSPRRAISGMRVATGAIFVDGPGIDGLDAAGAAGARRERSSRTSRDADGRAARGVLPHGTYTVSPDLLARLVAARGRGAGALWSTHAAETRAEQADVTARHGRSVIRHLDHSACSTRAPCSRIASGSTTRRSTSSRGPAPASSHNPVSNLKLASGIARVPDLLDAGRAGRRSAPTARSRATTSTCGWRCGSRRSCTTATTLRADAVSAGAGVRHGHARRRRRARAPPTGSARSNPASSPT